MEDPNDPKEPFKGDSSGPGAHAANNHPGQKRANEGREEMLQESDHEKRARRNPNVGENVSQEFGFTSGPSFVQNVAFHQAQPVVPQRNTGKETNSEENQELPSDLFVPNFQFEQQYLEPEAAGQQPGIGNSSFLNGNSYLDMDQHQQANSSAMDIRQQQVPTEFQYGVGDNSHSNGNPSLASYQNPQPNLFAMDMNLQSVPIELQNGSGDFAYSNGISFLRTDEHLKADSNQRPVVIGQQNLDDFDEFEHLEVLDEGPVLAGPVQALPRQPEANLEKSPEQQPVIPKPVSATLKTNMKRIVPNPMALATPEELIGYKLFNYAPEQLKLLKLKPIPITMRDVRTLENNYYLNDMIINMMLAYFSVNMIEDELLKKIQICDPYHFTTLNNGICPDTFSGRNGVDLEINPTFKPQIEESIEECLRANCRKVCGWAKCDIFTKEFVILPCNYVFHWTLVCIINPKGAVVEMDREEESRAAPKCYIAFFDPLGGFNQDRNDHFKYLMETFLHESFNTRKMPDTQFSNPFFDPKRAIFTIPQNLPCQRNLYDCGKFLLHFFEGIFYPNQTISVADFPHLDWSARFPKANEMAELMNYKAYNVILSLTNKEGREHISRSEKAMKYGLGREGNLRRSRRHSAENRRQPRRPEYYRRHYSVSPPAQWIMDDPQFTNPRELVEMPITKKLRAKYWPIISTSVIY
ncbi:unnamed protein product [Caenorhabditis sp. 36 PRJEB53466]|nr:unnamed protein product [Caenorhabditis sp. 36 PRJEB53466]